MSISVSIVEDDRGTRESLFEWLNGTPGLRCLSSYSTGEAALRGIPVELPEVVMVDINLPGMSGIECVAKLKAQVRDMQILMLTTFEESDLIFNSLRAGARGYLLKNTPPLELTEAIQSVHAGGAPMSMQIARKVVSHFQQIKTPRSEVEKLTKREQEILAHLAKGYLYKEIADQLGITLSTVRAHLHTVYEKLHVQTRTEAVVKFLARE